MVEKHTSRAPIVVIFVSSPFADEFPKAEMQQFTDSHIWKKILSVWTIALGTNGRTMERMAGMVKRGSMVKGHFRDVESDNELVQVFGEIK